MSSPLITPLPKRHLQRAGETIARAFYDDPLSVYTWPNPDKRLKPLIQQSVTTIRYGLIYGQTYTTSEVSGLLIGLQHSVKDFNLWRSIRSGMIFTPLLYGREGFKRMLQVVNYSAEIHKKVIQEPHCYLMQMGVDPTQQRHGIGKVLLATMLARIDTEQSACYLETMQEQTLALYQAFGFKVVAEGSASVCAPKTWFMLRSASG